jgi:uncharacterized membrane protein YagU involved in acid resistance
MKPKATADTTIWRPWVAAGLLCGVLDIHGAFLTAWLNAGRSPGWVLQAVASGLLGADAFQGGAGVKLFGLALHFSVAFGWAGVFVALSRRMPFLINRVWLAGPLYGAFVYLAMNLAVLPLAAQFRGLYLPETRPFVPRLTWSQLVVHLTCVGLAIAWAVQRFGRARAAQKEAGPGGPASVLT